MAIEEGEMTEEEIKYNKKSQDFAEGYTEGQKQLKKKILELLKFIEPRE